MLMTTRRADCAQSVARLMWPACRLPIVGAKATSSPAARHAATAARTALTLLTTRRRVCATLLLPISSARHARVSLREAVFLGRIAAILHGAHVGSKRLERRVAARKIVLHETRHAALRDAQHVVQHENLAIDAGTCADADDGNLHGIADRRADRVRHAFEQQRIGARLLERASLLDHAFCGFLLAPLHLETAELVYRLRLQAKVCAERNVLAREVLDDADLAAPDLELDHHGAAFLHQSHGVVERL